MSKGGLESNPLAETINLCQWAICLPRWILRSRTKFASCLARSFAVKHRSSETVSTVFPLPLPALDLFEGSGPGALLSAFVVPCQVTFVAHLDFGFGFHVPWTMANQR